MGGQIIILSHNIACLFYPLTFTALSLFSPLLFLPLKRSLRLQNSPCTVWFIVISTCPIFFSIYPSSWVSTWVVYYYLSLSFLLLFLSFFLILALFAPRFSSLLLELPTFVSRENPSVVVCTKLSGLGSIIRDLRESPRLFISIYTFLKE